MDKVTIHKAKTELSKLIARVEAGEEIVISRGNEPVAKLVPYTARGTGARKPGSWKGRFTVPDSALAPLTNEELGDFDERPPYGGFSE